VDKGFPFLKNRPECLWNQPKPHSIDTGNSFHDSSS
jgi:hypothetical protein